MMDLPMIRPSKGLKIQGGIANEKFLTEVLPMQASPIRKARPLCHQAKKRGIQVFHLNIGQPDIETPQSFFWKPSKKTDVKVLAYADSNGWEPLRESIAAYYRRLGLPYENRGCYQSPTAAAKPSSGPWSSPVTPARKFLFPNLLHQLPGFCGPFLIDLKPITHAAEEGFALRTAQDQWKAGSLTKTRGHRPFESRQPGRGSLQPEEVRRDRGMARDHGLFIIADEVYREFCYDGKSATSFASMDDVRDRVILADSVSKRFSACGAGSARSPARTGRSWRRP